LLKDAFRGETRKYFRRIATFGENILYHSRAIVQDFQYGGLTVTSQKLTVTFGADAERPVPNFMKQGD